MKKTIITAWVLVMISIIVGIYLYPQMPDKMASHWGAGGEVDGYMSKFWGLFLMPIVLAVCLLLFIGLPKIDPLKKNVEKFRNYYEGFILVFILFMAYIYSLTVAWNLGYTFNMSIMIIPAMGLLFYYIGVMVEHAKRNWFIGFKNPWTLSSNEVWEKTHKLGGKLFKASGIIALSGLFIQKYAIWLLLIPILFTAVYSTVYSYQAYKKVKK